MINVPASDWNPAPMPPRKTKRIETVELPDPERATPQWRLLSEMTDGDVLDDLAVCLGALEERGISLNDATELTEVHCDCSIEYLDEWASSDLERGLDAILAELDKRGELGVRFVGQDAGVVMNVVIEHAEKVIAAAKQEEEPKKNILEEALHIVTGARRSAYGKPENNFGRIADLWNVYLGGRQEPTSPISTQDVALLMVLMKVARLQETPEHRDSVIDIAGYAATIEMLWTGE